MRSRPMYTDHDDLWHDDCPLDGSSAMLARVLLAMLVGAVVLAVVLLAGVFR